MDVYLFLAIKEGVVYKKGRYITITVYDFFKAYFISQYAYCYILIILLYQKVSLLSLSSRKSQKFYQTRKTLNAKTFQSII